jgi:glutamyl/glutaminyl-tRNA synthetase
LATSNQEKTCCELNIEPDDYDKDILLALNEQPFAPEPSGYLHIGHAKAALASEGFARRHNGVFVLRFDDTNPVNESIDFEERILEDVALLDIHPDRVEHTSDFIPDILTLIGQMLRDGLAFIDDTPNEEMKELRGALAPSRRRDNSVEENERLWQEMLKGSDEGRRCVARAKIDFQSANGCLRDPTIARYVETPHARLPGVCVFPTYDVACPIVDSRVGITHAMRSWEYTDRNEQYKWFIDNLKLRPVEILSFSRLSFTRTCLGKRYLRALIADGHASGWDDPRFPTVRGLRRRGIQPVALRKFCEDQGASANQNMHDWDKLWATNRDFIEKTCPRVMSISVEENVTLTINGVQPGQIDAPIIPADRSKGTQKLAVGPNVWIARADLALISVGAKVTLMHWGNIIIDAWTDDRNFKGTPKLNWIVPETGVHIIFREWNHLLKVPELTKDSDITDVVCQDGFADTEIVCDPSIASAAKGSVWQLERRGEIIVDEPASEGKLALTFLIPSGKEGAIGLPLKISLNARATTT